ncbi:MAG: DUF4013 domain-containing protein [Candidatus Dormibacteria bacterium]
MENAGNSFGLPFRSPGWFGTLAVMGLVGLIPIVGQLAVTGWMLTLLDNYRAGRTDLPPAGFQHIGRGVNLFVVQLAYGLLLVAVLLGPVVFFLASAAAGGAASSASGSPYSAVGANPVFAVLSPLLFAGVSIFSLVIYLFMAPIVVNTERGGIRAGLNPVLLLRTAGGNWGHTALAAVLTFAAYFIGGLGIYACCIGYIVTMPYSYAVVAGVVRFYEATFETPQEGPPTASAAY